MAGVAEQLLENDTFTWAIPNFLELQKNLKTNAIQQLWSDVFVIGGYRWRLLLYPNGLATAMDKHLSVFLGVAEVEDLPDGWHRKAVFSISVVNHSDRRQSVLMEIGSQPTFSAINSDWGFRHLFYLEGIRTREGFLTAEGTLVLQTQVTSIQAWINSPLNRTVKTGNVDHVCELLAEHPDLESADEDGFSPLMNACHRGHREIAEILLAAGADIEKSNAFGQTSLWLASANGHAEVLALLVAAGANLNQTTNDGSTALWAASCNGHREVVAQLLAAIFLLDRPR
jgi:hypothetical protein